MNEEEKYLLVGSLEASYVLVNKQGEQVKVLVAGDVIELWAGGSWCQAHIESGGYKGWYFVTSDGTRGRFAVCMRVRLVEQAVAVPSVVLAPLEQLRLAWVGRMVKTRVPVAGGYVCGVVREITDRGVVLFVYTARLNGVPVLARVPVARLEVVLMLAAS